MGLKIYFSGFQERLAERLADELTAAATRQPLTPAMVIVPNPNVAKWLKLSLTERLGVLANVEFPYLEKGLWRLTKSVAGKSWGNVTMLGKDGLRDLIAARLLAGMESATPLTAYCQSPGGGFSLSEPDCARRVWQLSERLAALFREYEYNRGLSPTGGRERDMIGFWLDDGAGSFLRRIRGIELNESQLAIEKAQRDLFRDLFAAGGLLDQLEAESGARQSSLAMLARRLFADDASPPVIGEKHAPVFLFGLSQLSPFYCWLLRQLAAHRELRLFHFNVCREFWEDAETPFERRRREIRGAGISVGDQGEEFDLSFDNALLGAWGKAGRETVRMLAELEDDTGLGEIDWLDDDAPAPATVLAAVQHGIRHRAGEPFRLPADRSLRVAACPGRRREAETIHNSIIGNMMAGGLDLDDIAVLVPDMAVYGPVVASVFDAGGQVPYSLIDSNARIDSLFGQAVLAMLDLAGGDFTRSEVFALLGNPCVTAALGATRDDISQWLEWADTLGVFHCFDRRQRMREGLLDSENYTWQQGLRRLRMGRVIDDCGGGDTNNPFAETAPHEDMFSGGGICDRFSIAVELLFRRLRPLAANDRPAAEWAEKLNDLIDDFTAAPDCSRQEERVRTALKSALSRFAGKSGFGAVMTAAGLPRPDLPLAWMREFIAAALEGIPSRRGGSGGVTVAALAPMRPIPFKVIYVMGLNEGKFPGRDETAGLDLRGHRRMIGDVSRAEAGRYLFLETMMSAGRRLYLTYDCRDLRKDEQLFPCSVVRQLESHVNASVIDGGAAAVVPFRIELPINSHARELLDAETEDDLRRQWSFNERVLGYEMAGVDYTDALLELTGEASRRGRLAVKLLTEMPTPRSPERTGREESVGIIKLRIKDLAEFIKDPVEGFLRCRLGFYDDRGGVAEAALTADEPLRIGDDWNLKSKVLKKALASDTGAAADTARRLLRGEYDDSRRRSLAPEGSFAEIDRGNLIAAVDSSLEFVSAKLPKGKIIRDAVIGGHRIYDGSPEWKLPALTLNGIGLADGRQVDVELSGSLDLLWLGDDGVPAAMLLWFASSAPTKKNPPPAHFLPSWLFMLAALALDEERWRQGFDLKGFYKLGADKPTVGQWSYSGIDAAAAENYLRDLIADFLDATGLERFPYAIVNDDASFVETVMGGSDENIRSPEFWRERIENRIIDEAAKGEYSTLKSSMIGRLIDDRTRIPADPVQLARRRLLLPWKSQEDAS